MSYEKIEIISSLLKYIYNKLVSKFLQKIDKLIAMKNGRGAY